jgi:hypothetical protein
MSEQTSYRCDICNIEKQESNHWWKGYILDATPIQSRGLMVIPWLSFDLGLSDGGRIKLQKPDVHLCGEAHAIEWASKNLSKR